MSKSHSKAILIGAMTVLLLSACAEDKQDSQENKGISSTLPAPVKNSGTVAKVTKKVTNENNQSDSIMDEPVNFSTPEDAEETLQLIRVQVGEDVYKQLESAMSYKMQYDLSVGGSKKVLYKKLNGKTPNEIIALMKR